VIRAADDVEADLLGHLRLTQQFVRPEALVTERNAIDDVVGLAAARPENASDGFDKAHG
jgi:hypothetical protein